MQIFFDDLLRACYFMVIFAMILKCFRCTLEFKSTQQRFRLIGIGVALALAFAVGFIIIGQGHNPAITGYTRTILVRSSFAVFAVLALLFEVFYMKTFISIDFRELVDIKERAWLLIEKICSCVRSYM